MRSLPSDNFFFGPNRGPVFGRVVLLFQTTAAKKNSGRKPGKETNLVIRSLRARIEPASLRAIDEKADYITV